MQDAFTRRRPLEASMDAASTASQETASLRVHPYSLLVYVRKAPPKSASRLACIAILQCQSLYTHDFIGPWTWPFRPTEKHIFRAGGR